MTKLATRRSMLTRAAAVGALAALALTGCSGDSDGDGGSGDNGAEATSADLAGKTFTATEANGWVIVTGSTIQLTFDDGRISAQAGCNTLNGGATWTDDALVLDGPLASTMMACPAGLEAQDQWLTRLLESDPRLSFDGETLVLGDDRLGMTMTEDG